MTKTPTKGHETKYGKITTVCDTLSRILRVISYKNRPKMTENIVPKTIPKTLITTAFLIKVEAVDVSLTEFDFAANTCCCVNVLGKDR